MERIKIYVVGALMVFLFQACSVESNNHVPTANSGWNMDPMNPKYAMKRSNDHKVAPSDAKHSNIIRE